MRVYYEDTDLGGVVYYANYLRFMERARTEWLRAAGVDQTRLLAEHGLLFVIVGCELAYLRPARFDDLLDVSVVPTAKGRSRFTVEQEVRRGAEVLVTGRVSAACIDAASFRPRGMPASVRELLERRVDVD
ncbi:MAG: tol-pal system-associated acyl-CoA thioesterase [Xanthomonadaceae bacterium]|nr:tol-pal system-associated acyl-CoA thioesterase [Xanthomonadaceae bacterium]